MRGPVRLSWLGMALAAVFGAKRPPVAAGFAREYRPTKGSKRLSGAAAHQRAARKLRIARARAPKRSY